MAGDKKPIDDVNKPGTTPATATSRPIIVGHGSALRDPMVNTAPEVDDTKVEPRPPAAKKIIAPIDDDVRSAATAEAAKSPETDDLPKDEAPEEKSAVSDEAVVDAVLEQVNDPKKQQQQSEEDQKRADLVDKLVEEKKYFLPIDRVHSRRRHRTVLIIVVVLLLIAAGGVAAVDAGLIKTSITLPFDLIKN